MSCISEVPFQSFLTRLAHTVGPLVHADLLQIFQALGLLLGDVELPLPPKVFCWALMRTLVDSLCYFVIKFIVCTIDPDVIHAPKLILSVYKPDQ